MKGKRYTTEDKIRILLVAEWSEKSVPEICREQNISEVSFHRWKRQFGHMEVNEARRLKELEREMCHRSHQNPPVGVTSKPATPRCEVHNRFKVGFKVCSVSASAAYRE